MLWHLTLVSNYTSSTACNKIHSEPWIPLFLQSWCAWDLTAPACSSSPALKQLLFEAAQGGWKYNSLRKMGSAWSKREGQRLIDVTAEYCNKILIFGQFTLIKVTNLILVPQSVFFRLKIPLEFLFAFFLKSGCNYNQSRTNNPIPYLLNYGFFDISVNYTFKNLPFLVSKSG